MISELFSSLAAPFFAAVLLLFFLKSRSREINGGEASSGAAGNDGTAGGASSTHSSTEVPEMATSTGYDYEVFLSFRGPDTRATFADHLYTRLKDLGIRAFEDDEDLRSGEELAPELLQAIKQSKILVPIFSKDYASSVWCLKEVVQMVECKKTKGQKIMPIFYDVAPSEVRHQTGGYKKAFLLHDSKKRYDQKTIGEWKAALSVVGGINGYNLQSMPNRREGEFVKKFTREVFNELKKASLVVSNLVDVDNHVDAIMEKIGVETSETRIIGIHGMGGVGKTTIAKIIYNRLSENFEGCCFLSNIREISERKGIECLQNQLISDILGNKCTDVRNIDDGIKIIKDRLSNKRVLLLLDDLYEENHMDALVGERDWLGKGSKLIITTRNKETLDVPTVDDYYELAGMDHGQSLKLFSKHAFKRDSPLDEYINQSNRAIKIAGGLPLALEVIGSLLSRTEKEKWDLTLNKLENAPDDKIQSKLKISYDALNWRQQHMFLDIACLFIGYDKDILVHFWDESNFFPEVDMKVLQNLSLIKIDEDNELWMHDQFRDLGREMVRQKSEMKIEKQSRVWDPKVGSDLLRKHKGKKEVQALCLKLERQHHFTYEGFENLSDLSFLELDGWMGYFRAEERLLWHESPSNVLPTNENSYLLPQLRWLSGCDIPSAFNVANFFTKDLVILSLYQSEITDDWKGWSHMKVMKNLKVLILSKCHNLQRLPDELGKYLASLEYLSLSECEWLERLPDSIENMESLIELDISNTRIEELPDSIKKLKNLKKLKMWCCHKIRKIPDALWTIEKLEEVEASSINGFKFHGNVGNCIYKNQSLRILKLVNTDICSLPRLPESLVTLHLDSLNMDTFPDLSKLTNLKELKLKFLHSRDFDWESHVTTSPMDLTLPPNLKSLDLRYCTNLRRLLRFPSSLSFLHLYHCYSLCSMGDLSNLNNLSYLNIRCTAIEEIQGLGCLENLRDLELWFLPQLKMIPDLSNLNKLRRLDVNQCGNLVEIQGELPRFLDKLSICNCDSLHNLPDLSSLMGKHEVIIRCCSKLNVEAILGFARLNRPDLRLWGFGQLQILPDLSNSSELRYLQVWDCHNLIEIQGELPQSLDFLGIDSCESLLKLPDLSSLNRLKMVNIRGCKQLKGEAILGSARTSQANLWENLQDLWICGLEQMEILPDLSNLSKLRCLRVQSCDNLVEIEGEFPESLEVLEISSCKKIQKLPDLTGLNGLRRVNIDDCSGLNVEAFSSLCSEKSVQFGEGYRWRGRQRPVKFDLNLNMRERMRNKRRKDVLLTWIC